MKHRNTIQRAIVLDAVRSLHSHATAEQIFDYIKEHHPSVGRATVYRNLNYLAECGEILKIYIPGQPEHFDHHAPKHYHIICEKCSRVFDVDMPLIEGLENSIRDSHGFEFRDFDIIFKGICPDCSGKNK